METTATTATQTASNNTTKSEEQAPAISSDFQTFLTMLTTQMENQDPLNPVDSTDFAVQLATFSGVEQQVRTNDLLSGLTTLLGADAIGQAADLVGLQVRAAVPASFDGQPVTVFPQTATLADKAELVVRDVQGNEVDRVTIDPAQDQVTWSGRASNGTAFLNGSYSFAVESFANDQSLGETPAEVYDTVAEARLDGTSVTLILSSGQEVAMSDISGVKP